MELNQKLGGWGFQAALDSPSLGVRKFLLSTEGGTSAEAPGSPFPSLGPPKHGAPPGHAVNTARLAPPGIKCWGEGLPWPLGLGSHPWAVT